ncbi:hypothetical protein [Bacillus phage SPO1L1]|nr:hypothetical protein [Bacillus phage SPO1L1]WIT26003.1 hypothetical protein [Bacillus phage SPO1L2]
MNIFLLIVSLGVAIPTSFYVLLATLNLLLDRNLQISKRMVLTYICWVFSWAVAIQTFVGWG